MTRSDLLNALAHPNVQAFLHVIRAGETNQSDDAYRTMFGGALFNGWEHPHQVNRVNGLASSAAGAYQFLSKTWDGLVAQYGFEDFSPPMQDLGAVALIAGRDALQLVKEGCIREAIARCSREWASLPGSPYGQPRMSLDKALSVYLAAGGSLDQTPAEEVKPMGPAIVIPILAELAKTFLPQLGQLFGSGSEVQQRNVAAATLAADAIVKATNSINLQEAAEKIQTDPDALASAKQVVGQLVTELGEAGGGGIKGARDAALATEGDWRKVVFSAPFMLAVAVLPLIYGVVLASLLKFEWLAEITSEVRTGVITSVTGLILGSLMGYFYGTSASSQKKDAALAQR